MTRIKSLFSYREKSRVPQNEDAPKERAYLDEGHYDDLVESLPSGTDLPGGEDSRDVPGFLLQDPTGHIHTALLMKGIVQLDFQEFLQQGACFVCKVGCTINRTGDTVTVQGTGTSKVRAIYTADMPVG